MEDKDRPAKLRKLETFRRSLPYVSASALSAILKELDREEPPELKGRKHLKEARDYITSQETVYGPLLVDVPVQMSNGSQKGIQIVNFLALLQLLYEQEGSFFNLVEQTAVQYPPSSQLPWKLLYYTDEITCGNPLALKPSRKIQTVYVSIAQFGGVNLAKELAWAVLCTRRSSEVDEVAAGMSQLTAAILRHILLNPLSTMTGIVLKSKSGHKRRIFLSMGYMVQDGLAQKTIWSLRGDSGTRYCVLCQNLIARQSSLDEDILTCDMSHQEKILLATDEDLKGTWRRLEEKSNSCTASAMKTWMQATGFTYHPLALPWAEDLSSHMLPATQFIHDYMHCFFQKGVFNSLTYWFFESLETLQGMCRVLWAVGASWCAQDCIGQAFQPR